ncbi:DciA family protein [Saccharothrix sp. NRRL B-16314]|uniref:DciA family protein n=1 Tax=Saccharothrix sp. NRRL B-16314 TaxID=1463825 RepID=UPI0005253174
MRGPDLARAALEAARASAKARGARGARKGSVPAAGRRRRRRWSGPGPDDRDPQPLGRLASRMAADRGWAERLAGGQVFARWAKLVGEDVAEHAKPVALSDNELTVQADSTAWATQLRLLQRDLLKRIAAGVGDGVVQKLKVQGPAAPSWRYGPRHAPGRGPRDTYG